MAARGGRTYSGGGGLTGQLWRNWESGRRRASKEKSVCTGATTYTRFVIAKRSIARVFNQVDGMFVVPTTDDVFTAHKISNQQRMHTHTSHLLYTKGQQTVSLLPAAGRGTVGANGSSNRRSSTTTTTINKYTKKFCRLFPSFLPHFPLQSPLQWVATTRV